MVPLRHALCLVKLTPFEYCSYDESILRDRTFMEEMKADILRRAEEISDDEEEARGIDLAYDDEDGIGGSGKLKISGDGEDIDEDEENNGEETSNKPPSPETILELAYIRDPKLFDRDAATRRSKARSDLKAQTGWADEQIEGWRIMLERNVSCFGVDVYFASSYLVDLQPRKDKILSKHEFAGNQNRSLDAGVGSSPSSGQGRGSGERRGGRGGRGRGRGRGRGDGGGGGGDSGNSAKERAWKDKNKASRANHDRKRGHDKKLAGAGAGPPT
jgi:activating signal cointegrator complex subunit 2